MLLTIFHAADVLSIPMVPHESGPRLVCIVANGTQLLTTAVRPLALSYFGPLIIDHSVVLRQF